MKNDNVLMVCETCKMPVHVNINQDTVCLYCFYRENYNDIKGYID